MLTGVYSEVIHLIQCKPPVKLMHFAHGGFNKMNITLTLSLLVASFPTIKIIKLSKSDSDTLK